MHQNHNNNILLIHAARNDDNIHDATVMSMGLLMLADFLTARGQSTKVLNLPLMLLEDPSFDLINYIKQHQIGVIGLSLQWHWQIYETISLAKAIKLKSKNIHIILGGFTASFFHQEILKKVDWIDFIIRGDSEIPLHRLIKILLSEQGSLPTVPNLTWRKENKIVINPHKYTITKEIIGQLNYFNTSLLVNDLDMFMKKSASNYAHLGKTLYFNIGRGCSSHCSCCGGSDVSQEIINKRKVVVSDADDIIRNLRAANSLNPNYIHTSFDPCPHSDSFVPLFKKISNENFMFSLIFTSWGLPSTNFISALTTSFKKPYLILSPDTWSEKLRAKNKGFSFSNRDMIKTLNLCAKKNMVVKCFFATGFPFETKEDFQKTLTGIKFLKKNFDIKIIGNLISLDPASPMFLDPQKYRIQLKRKTFKDFLEASAIKNQALRCGYETEYFSEQQIISNYETLLQLCSSV